MDGAIRAFGSFSVGAETLVKFASVVFSVHPVAFVTRPAEAVAVCEEFLVDYATEAEAVGGGPAMGPFVVIGLTLVSSVVMLPLLGTNIWVTGR